MTPEILDWWNRALRSLASARVLADSDPDSAASRAYYAAFAAVSALFVLRGQYFSKHTALLAAVHRDLVKGGLWPVELGADFSSLADLRATGDYGGAQHVSRDAAKAAIRKAERIMDAVRRTAPEPLPDDEGPSG